MKPTLADDLKIILPVAAEIATPETRVRLEKIAQFLPPIPRGGFECRLSKEVTQVDLQQCILAKDNEPQILINHIADLAANRTIDSSAWKCIQQFCQAWSDRGSLFYNNITDIWLEFDVDDFNAPIPSIFLSFNSNLTDAEVTLEIARDAFSLLLNEPISNLLESNLYRCLTACTPPTRISHLGIMRSRQSKALRVNVNNLPPDRISTYLQTIGFLESVDRIEALTAQLLNFVDRVRVCLDVGTTIYSNIGLECFFTQKSEIESRWSGFLDYLVKRGLCTSEKRDALLAWLGYSTPQSSFYPWPGHLIAESLLKPPDRFSAFNRSLSHVKLVCSPQHPLQAKGYLEFSHQWLQPVLTKEE